MLSTGTKFGSQQAAQGPQPRLAEHAQFSNPLDDHFEPPSNTSLRFVEEDSESTFGRLAEPREVLHLRKEEVIKIFVTSPWADLKIM